MSIYCILLNILTELNSAVSAFILKVKAWATSFFTKSVIDFLFDLAYLIELKSLHYSGIGNENKG